jgi:hypothetical protein
MHRGCGRNSHRSIHGGDDHKISGYVLLDLLRDIDSLPFVAELREDFDDASKKCVTRYTKRVVDRPSRTASIPANSAPVKPRSWRTAILEPFCVGSSVLARPTE